MELQPIIVTHILPSTTSFGATCGARPEAVFIPGKVSNEAGLVVGQKVMAQLVPNTMQPEKTPWLAARVEMVEPEGVEELVTNRALDRMLDGGVWTATDISEEIGVTTQEAQSLLLEAFEDGKCAKFELKRAPKAAPVQWFTCYPDRADVAEWAED
jgi:hypothetical protein